MEFLVQIAIAIAVNVVAYLLTPKPKKEEPPELENPTSEAGRPIPKVFGTVTVKDPNVLWFGNKHKRTYKVTK